MATLEELEQQIEELRSLITTEYQPPSGEEYSFPVVGQPLSDEQWQYVTLPNGDGIIEVGGSPYNLKINGSEAQTNASNTMLLTVSTVSNTAEAVLRGFYHRMTQDKALSFPGVSTRTVYYVVLQYDPLNHKTAGGPIRVEVVTSLDTSMGKRQLLLWSLEREPNQLLTDATIRRYRPRVVPTQLVYTHDQLPDPSKVVWGSMYFVHETSEIVMAVGATQEAEGPTLWKNLTSPDWTRSTSQAYEWAGHGPQPQFRVIGDRVELRGHVKRKNGVPFYRGNESNRYSLIPNVPRPDIASRAKAWSGELTNPMIVQVICDPGELPVFLPSRDTSVIDLTGCFYYLR